MLESRSPTDNARSKDRLSYWIWLAKLAEKGKVTSIFFADSYAGHEDIPGSKEAIYKSGTHTAMFDPTTVISASKLALPDLQICYLYSRQY